MRTAPIRCCGLQKRDSIIMKTCKIITLMVLLVAQVATVSAVDNKRTLIQNRVTP